MTERCERTDLLVDQCAHCRGHDSAEEEVATSRPFGGAWFPARYPGKCNACGEWFGEGTQIRHNAPGYIADCCPDAK